MEVISESTEYKTGFGTFWLAGFRSSDTNQLNTLIIHYGLTINGHSNSFHIVLNRDHDKVWFMPFASCLPFFNKREAFIEPMKEMNLKIIKHIDELDAEVKYIDYDKKSVVI